MKREDKNMLKETSSIIFGIIIAALILIVAILGFKCKDLSNTINNERILHQQALDKIKNEKETVEDQIRNIMDQTSEKIIVQDNEEKARVEYVTKEVEKVVFTPTYSNVCIDNRGIELINQLIQQRGEINEKADAINTATVLPIGVSASN